MTRTRTAIRTTSRRLERIPGGGGVSGTLDGAAAGGRGAGAAPSLSLIHI
ncbi:MAG: hypothetical protein QUU85_18855 [Candidatus Eisenbacteria bacterium]|nr:hypothetical protein [Candidatus Eisenbacteria bacterium]